MRTFPNVAVGTYSVEVTFAGLSDLPVAQDIAVRLNAAVRVDARLSVGALQESVQVSAQSVLLQTETAAVQTQTTSQQLQNLPINGRSFQSMLTLTPVSRSPTTSRRAASTTPRDRCRSRSTARRTRTRCSVSTASARPTSGFRACRPTPGHRSDRVRQRRHQQLRRRAGHGRRRVGERADQERNERPARLGVRAISHAGLRSRNYFLPADQDKTKDTKNVFGGTVGGPIKRDKVFYFVSLENTMQRAIGGPYVTQATGSASQFLSIPTAAIRSGNFSGTGSVIYDPATGNSLGQNRVPFAFANCGITSTADPRFDSCNFIPAARINQVAKNILSHLPLPQLAGNANNYFAVPKFNTDFYKLDSKVSWNATNRLNMNGRLSYLPESELAGGLYGDDGGVNPLAVGTLLDSNISSAAVSVTHITSPTFVVDGLFGFTRQHTYQQPRAIPIRAGDRWWASSTRVSRRSSATGPCPGLTSPFRRGARWERHPRQRQHGLGLRLPRPAVAMGGERRLEQGRSTTSSSGSTSTGCT